MPTPSTKLIRRQFPCLHFPEILLHDREFRAILISAASFPLPVLHRWPAATDFFEWTIMELCDECAKLQGCSADLIRKDGMTLVGIGECEGKVAIEHYRCEECGTVMVRQLAGKLSERVWAAFYKSADTTASRSRRPSSASGTTRK